MPAYSARRREAIDTGTAPARFRDVLAGSVVAFFVIYAAWGLVVEDATEYSASYFEQLDFFALPEGYVADPFALGLTWLTASIVVVAFALRLLLKRFAARLPGAAGFVAVYIEAVWVFVAVLVIRTAVDALPSWLATRRVVQWLGEVRDGMFDAVPALRVVLDVWNWLFAEGVETVVMPLMWLALVGIVYANSLPEARGEGPVTRGFLPMLRRRARDLGDDLLQRWRPIGGSARTIWAAGAPTMGFVILLLAVVAAASEWTDVAVFRLIAPQESGFWMGADRALSLVSRVIWEPVRICVLAAAFDTCLQFVGATRDRALASDAQGSSRIRTGDAAKTVTSITAESATPAGTTQV